MKFYFEITPIRLGLLWNEGERENRVIIHVAREPGRARGVAKYYNNKKIIIRVYVRRISNVYNIYIYCKLGLPNNVHAFVVYQNVGFTFRVHARLLFFFLSFEYIINTTPGRMGGRSVRGTANFGVQC